MNQSVIQLQIPQNEMVYSDAATGTLNPPTQCDAIMQIHFTYT